MQCAWLGERVAAPNLRQVVRNVLTKEEAGNWGPNATFRFATKGGTGGIWTAIADTISSKYMRLGEKGKVETVKADEKVVVLSSGRKIRYQNLVSTMPVDKLLENMEVEEEHIEEISRMRSTAADKLVYSSTIVLGLGIRGVRPDRIGDKCECRVSLIICHAHIQAGYTSPKMTHPSTVLRSSPTTPPSIHLHQIP